MLGREVNLPADLIFPSSAVKEDPPSTHQYVSDLACSLENAHEVARQNLKTCQKRMNKDYDLRQLVHSYETVRRGKDWE